MQEYTLLHKTQEIVAQDRHRFRVVCSGRRWGKTTLAILEMVAKGVFKDDAKIVYIAPTYQQARDIAWNELKKICKPIAQNINEARLEITIKTRTGNTSIIWLRGWESVETLRGQRFDFVVIDEIASMRNFYLNWEEVIRPALTDRRGEVLFISTPKGFNHFYNLYNSIDEDYKAFHFTTYDNPHMPVDEIEKAKKELPDDRFAQEYLADFRKQEGLIYKDFDRGRHLFDDFTPKRQILRRLLAGPDWGYVNPAAAYLLEVDADNHYWLSNEYYKRNKTTAEIIEFVKTYKTEAQYPDPAEADRIEEMKRAGMNPQEVSKDVEKGIDSVRQLLKTGRLHIHKDCINLINEFETYRYKEKQTNSNEPESPVKENDHGLDAIRYALFIIEPAYEEMTEDFNLYSDSFK